MQPTNGLLDIRRVFSEKKWILFITYILLEHILIKTCELSDRELLFEVF